MSVRFKFEDADPIEQILGKKFMSFLMKRAEEYVVMRRIPIEVSIVPDVVVCFFVHGNSIIPGKRITLFSILHNLSIRENIIYLLSGLFGILSNN